MAYRLNVPKAKYRAYSDFEALWLEFHKPLLNRYRALVRDYHDGEDLTSELFAQLLDYSNRHGLPEGKVTETIATIGNRILVKFRRTRGVNIQLDEFDAVVEGFFQDHGTQDPLRHLIVERVTDEVQEFMDTLTKQNKEIFIGRCLYQDRGVDVAKDLKTSSNNVNVKLSRIREELKDFFDGRDVVPTTRWETL